MKASSECLAHRWKSMTSRMLLRGVSGLDPAGSGRKEISDVSLCLLLVLIKGEDPLAGDQNDHAMDSIAGVLKLYFRGMDQALFPKDVFHDLISCVCKSLILWSVFV